jgi:hypothetical protein
MPLSIINSVGHMRRSLLLYAFSTVALAFFTAPAPAQSRCANAKVSEIVFEQRPAFAESLRGAKALFVGVYHNSQSGLIDPPPPDSLDKVVAVLRQWPVASKNEQEMLRDVKTQLSHWGQYRLTTDISKANLIMVVKLGRDKNDPIAHGGYLDIPQQFLWDDSLHLYAFGVKPGLVWCGNEAGGLHVKNGNLLLVQKLEVDALRALKTP